jgi:hypothetical protein
LSGSASITGTDAREVRHPYPPATHERCYVGKRSRRTRQRLDGSVTGSYSSSLRRFVVGIGASLILITAGAVLAFAVDATTTDF